MGRGADGCSEDGFAWDVVGVCAGVDAGLSGDDTGRVLESRRLTVEAMREGAYVIHGASRHGGVTSFVKRLVLYIDGRFEHLQRRDHTRER